MQKSNLPSLSFIPPCATVKSTIPEFHTSLCNRQIYCPEFHTSLFNNQIYHPWVSYLPVQKSKLPSLSFIPLFDSQIYHPWVSYFSEQQSNLPSPSYILPWATVKSTIPEFHTSVCNSTIVKPRASFLPVQKSNLPSLRFIPLFAIVKSTIAQFYTSVCNTQIYHPEFHTSLCKSQIYHPWVSYLSVQQSNRPSLSFIHLCSTVKSTIPEFNTSLFNS